MADSAEKAKIPGRLLLAFIKQQFKNAIGDEITDELGEIGEELLGESLDSWLSGKQRQIERAEEKAHECFKDACCQQGLDERFLQWIESLPLDNLPAVQRAIARLPQQVDDSELRQVLQDEIAAAWKELEPAQAQQAAELYLDCLKRGLATQRDFQQDILVKEVLAMARQIAQIRQETALIPKILTILERLEARLAGGQAEPVRYQPPPLPPIAELQDLNRLPPGSWVAHLRNPFFTGREEDLKTLAQALLYRPGEGTAVGITGTPHAAAATGLGGIGKSQLAVECCWRYGGYFQGVHWVAAGGDISGGSIPAGIASCGEQMGLQPWPAEQADQVQLTLKAWREAERRLVVFDDVPDSRAVAEWLPRLGNARLLVTSRWTDWPGDLALEQIPLDMLSREESLALLRLLAPRLAAVEDELLVRLAERLYRLPLALDLAGRYLQDRHSLAVGQYLDELERQAGLVGHRSLLDWTQHNPTRHETGLAATFLLSWRQLDGRKKAERLAQLMFLAAGYCAANTPIPEEVLLLAAGVEDEKGAGQAALGLQCLYSLGLLERAGEGASIHPMLAELPGRWTGSGGRLGWSPWQVCWGT